MTTEEATAQGSNSCICLSMRLDLLALWKIPEYKVIIIVIVIIFRNEMFLFLAKIIKLSREAEHSNFKWFPLASVSTLLQGKLSFFSHKATSIQSINDHCK